MAAAGAHASLTNVLFICEKNPDASVAGAAVGVRLLGLDIGKSRLIEANIKVPATINTVLKPSVASNAIPIEGPIAIAKLCEVAKLVIASPLRFPGAFEITIVRVAVPDAPVPIRLSTADIRTGQGV